ncbi:MAG: helix-turn-helix transcriptional regulator [Aeromicrobium sp.]|uniref:helix-turn-helix domain-containing protein n=1 Tax=Aeromicrobium sp. TaxID=1871063 RepID=UPI0039E2C74B
MPRVASNAAAHIGARIAEHRVRQGLTQDEVAVRTSIDSSNIRAYEHGRAMPSVFTLVRIAQALDVPAGDLLDGLTPEQFTTPAADRRRRPS